MTREQRRDERLEREAVRRERFRRVAGHRRRQHGLITRAQLLAAGWSSSGIDHALRDGTLARMQRGVYAPAGVPITFDVRLMAAILRTGEDAVAIGLTAARLWQLPDCDRIDAVELAVPRREAPRLAGAVRVRGYPWLEEEHTVRVGRYRVLNAAHTIAGCCARWPADRALDGGADLWRRRQGSFPDALAEVSAVRGRYRGAATLREVLGHLDPGYACTRSVAEVRAYRHLKGSPLPTPRVNVRRRMTSGRRWEFDLLWDLPRAILEIDGRHHLTPSQAARDAAKDVDAATDGCLLRRVPAVLTNDSDAFLDVVARLLHDAERR